MYMHKRHQALDVGVLHRARGQNRAAEHVVLEGALFRCEVDRQHDLRACGVGGCCQKLQGGHVQLVHAVQAVICAQPAAIHGDVREDGKVRSSI